jgi:DNA-binding MarR family transcriptional regulator
MARKKSSGSGGSDPADDARVRRVPMREFARSLPMSLLRAREAVMRQFRPSLRSHGLTEQQRRILRALAAVDAIEVTELALAKADLRRSVVSISAKGLKLIEAVAPTSEAIYAAITTRYGARKLAELQDMLHELERSLLELRVVEDQNVESGEFE